MANLYKGYNDLPAYLSWEKEVIDTPGINKESIGYYYLLVMIEVASRHPYSSLAELYEIGISENAFQSKNQMKDPSYSCVYIGMSYALKNTANFIRRSSTVKRFIGTAALKLNTYLANKNNGKEC